MLLPNRLDLSVLLWHNAECTFLIHTVITPPLSLFDLAVVLPLPSWKQTKKPRNFFLDKEQELQQLQFLCRFLSLGPQPAAHWSSGRCGKVVSSTTFLLQAQELTTACSSPCHLNRKWGTCGMFTHSSGKKLQFYTQINSRLLHSLMVLLDWQLSFPKINKIQLPQCKLAAPSGLIFIFFHVSVVFLNSWDIYTVFFSCLFSTQ